MMSTKSTYDNRILIGYKTYLLSEKQRRQQIHVERERRSLLNPKRKD
ncbi:hypothetical protein Goshw_020717, partial [Gossypium schwendimanii]|nr:hypothetical protein [Gossypium schwendimanii]